MCHNLEIKEGAYIIADAHYSHLREELLSLIKEIHSKKLLVSQLILMGDIFDVLVGDVEHTHTSNTQMIELINGISEFIEVLYLEGNHDYNLQKIFPKVKVFPIQSQPIICSYKNKSICLAHGDFDGGMQYKIYTAVIRNSLSLYVLKSIDTLLNHFILQKLDTYLSTKDDCKKFVGFREFVEKRLESRVACDYFIEGHYHQNISMEFSKTSYINLGAFACNQRYFIVKSSQEKELLEEKIFSKGI